MNSHRMIAPVMLALTLAFSTVAMAQTPAPAVTPRVTTKAEWAAIMQQRLAMIEALEVTHDDTALATLIAADKGLDNYAVLLLRTTGHLHDPRLLEKLLDFPTLDKSSPEYIHAVGGIFAEIVANAPKPEEAKLSTLMFERIKNDKTMLNDALRFIFETSAMFYGDNTPNVEMTRLLIANGADLDTAVASVKEEILSKNNPLLRDFTDEHLARLEKFRAAVTAPVKTQPAPQTFTPKG